MGRIIRFLIFTIVFFVSCNSSTPSTQTLAPTVKLASKDLDKTFRLKPKTNSVRYLKLEDSKSNSVKSISQIYIENDTIYILDRQQSTLFLFNIDGRFLKKFCFENEKLINFDVLKNTVYLLEKKDGILHRITTGSSLIQTDTLGLLGVQFKVLSNNRLIFNTGGLRTKNSEANIYQLSEFSLNNNHSDRMYLPFKEIYKNLRYYNPNQLFKREGTLYYCALFENLLYKYSDNKFIPYLQFDFGKYTLSDSLFLKKINADDLGYLPYVTDLAIIAQTDSYAFFSFTFKNELGYLLLRLIDKKVISVGLGSEAGVESHYNNTVPAGSYGNEFFAIVWPQKEMDSMQNTPKNRIINKSHIVEKSENPVLMFYQL